MAHIVVVEDDPTLAVLLVSYLTRSGHTAELVRELARADEACLAAGIDLVLLDVNLPYHDGFYWCNRIRQRSDVPIIFVSVRADDLDQVTGLRDGGDDYVVKPFHPDVLLAKIAAIVKRTASSGASGTVQVKTGDLVLDLRTDRARFAGRGAVDLTALEARLLAALMRGHGEAVRRSDLLGELWDQQRFVEDNTLAVNSRASGASSRSSVCRAPSSPFGDLVIASVCRLWKAFRAIHEPGTVPPRVVAVGPHRGVRPSPRNDRDSTCDDAREPAGPDRYCSLWCWPGGSGRRCSPGLGVHPAPSILPLLATLPSGRTGRRHNRHTRCAR